MINEVTVHPLRLGVVEYRGACNVRSAEEQVSLLVEGAHQMPESVELRVVSLRAEVRRAVRVRIDRAERVRDEMVHSAHEQEIGQPLHDSDAFRPAVSAEDLAHRSALHLRVELTERRGELREYIIVEDSVALVSGA